MPTVLVLVLLAFILPVNSAHASNTNPVIEVGNLQFNSANQSRTSVSVYADSTSDSNKDIPTLKLSIDNLDELTVKKIVQCSLRNYGANYYENWGAGRVVYRWQCNFRFADEVQFDSNKLKFRITATHVGKVSFIDSEIELGNLVTFPSYKVEKLQVTQDGEFRFQVSTRRNNLKVPAENVRFEICLEGFPCEVLLSTPSGLVDYSRTVTKTGNMRLIVRVTATVDNILYALPELNENLFRSPIAPTPTARPTIIDNSNSGVRVEKEPTTKLRASIKVPVAAKLGVPFPVTVSIKGSGTASCYFTVYLSRNGWGSYNTTGGTASKLFQVKGGKSVTTRGVMAVNYKGPWGVILYCTDVKSKADLPIVVGRLIQN